MNNYSIVSERPQGLTFNLAMDLRNNFLRSQKLREMRVFCYGCYFVFVFMPLLLTAKLRCKLLEEALVKT